MIICPNCNTQNQQDAKKCPNCKKKLISKKSTNAPLIAIVGATVLLISVIAIYFLSETADNSEIVQAPSLNADSTNLEQGLFTATGAGSDIHGAIHRIEDNGNVVYLFGTMHAAAPEWFPLADIVEEAMRRADVFAFEFDLTLASVSLDELATLVDLFQTGQYLQEQTLADVVSANVHAAIVRYIETYGLTYEEIYRKNPIALATELQVAVMADVFAEFGIYYDEQIGVDGYILDFAMQNARPIIGLEPIEQQIRIGSAPNQEILDRAGFTGTLDEIFYDALVDFVPRDELFTTLYDSTATHYQYKNNDIEGIIAAMDVNSDELENAFTRYTVEVLLNFRSTYYANAIANLLRTTDEPTTFFVAVGLSHVIRQGEYLTNIVEQLELLGITAEPIWNSQ